MQDVTEVVVLNALDLIRQDFTAQAPNTRWCGDITYTRTVAGWAYTATVIDPARGERWFCTEAEAEAAGWRRTKVC